MTRLLKSAALVIAVLLMASPKSFAQFRDLNKRPRTDTTAINEFIRSYKRQLEPLFAATKSGETFGPLNAVSNGNFQSDDKQTMPLESAETLVTLHSAGTKSAIIGAAIGGVAGIVYWATQSHNNADKNLIASPGGAYVFGVGGGAAGGLLGFIVGSFFTISEDAAPMNAFRMP
jgi:hypothetical protein